MFANIPITNNTYHRTCTEMRCRLKTDSITNYYVSINTAKKKSEKKRERKKNKVKNNNKREENTTGHGKSKQQQLTEDKINK